MKKHVKADNQANDVIYVIELVFLGIILGSLDKPPSASKAWHRFCMDVRSDIPNLQVNGKHVIRLVKSVGDYEEGYRGSDSFYIPAEIDVPDGIAKLVVKIRLSNHPARGRPGEVLWDYILDSGKKNYSNDRKNIISALQMRIEGLWDIWE